MDEPAVNSGESSVTSTTPAITVAADTTTTTTTTTAFTGPAIYLYPYGAPSNGNLGGRIGADQLCQNSPAKPVGCANPAQVHAFLTVSPTDQISAGTFASTSSTQPPIDRQVVFIKDDITSALTPTWQTFLATRKPQLSVLLQVDSKHW